MTAILAAVGLLLCVAVEAVAAPRVICKDAGAGGYQAFPDVTRLSNGDLICVFYAGYTHVSLPVNALPRGGRIVSMRSRDNGKTWSSPQTVIDTPLDDRDPHVSQAPDGTLFLSFFTAHANEQMDVYVAKSRNLGKSWGAPIHVSSGLACSAPVRQSADGTLLLPVYGLDKAKTPHEVIVGVVRSNDRGATWGKPVLIPRKSGHDHNEMDIAILPGGELLAVMRPCMCRSTSRDNGLTWSDPEPLGFEGAAPCLLRTSKGVLLLAHRLPHTALHYSTDDGKTWRGPVELDKVSGAYAGMAELPDGRILCVYYEEGERSAIRQVTFRADSGGVHLDG